MTDERSTARAMASRTQLGNYLSGHYISIGTLSIMGHTCTFWGIKGRFIGTISAGTQYLIIRSFLLYWDTIY